MSDQGNEKFNLDPEKAYYLQRIDVLNECRAELLSDLKKRAWIVLAIVAIVGYLGLDTLLRQRLTDTGALALLQLSLRDDEQFVNRVSGNIPPVQFIKLHENLQIQPRSDGLTKTLSCPPDMVPVSGGVKNAVSKANLVQMFTEQRTLVLQVYNGEDKPISVDAWAICIKATEIKTDAAQ